MEQDFLSIHPFDSASFLHELNTSLFLGFILLEFRCRPSSISLRLHGHVPFLTVFSTLRLSHDSTSEERCGGGVEEEGRAAIKLLKLPWLHPVNIFLFICPSLHAQSYYLCTASKWQPSGSPYKIYIGNVTFNDGSEEKDEGWEGWNTAGCFKGIISYICAFPEVIIEWQWLEGNPFLSSGKDC